jgi:hypothetical protein
MGIRFSDVPNGLDAFPGSRSLADPVRRSRRPHCEHRLHHHRAEEPRPFKDAPITSKKRIGRIRGASITSATCHVPGIGFSDVWKSSGRMKDVSVTSEKNRGGCLSPFMGIRSSDVPNYLHTSPRFALAGWLQDVFIASEKNRGGCLAG